MRNCGRAPSPSAAWIVSGPRMVTNSGCLSLVFDIRVVLLLGLRFLRGLGLGFGQAQFLHQLLFLGPLAQLGLPVLSLAGVFVGQRGGVIGQALGLGTGLLGR